jgi:hypothetical protein
MVATVTGFAALLARNVDFHGDLVRNIKGIRRSQHLFDDLSSDPRDWEVAIAAEGEQRVPTSAAVISRPFDYGTAIGYAFDAANWHATRFSDGSRYGVWYGALDVRTTVYETVFHWHRFLQDSFAGEDRAITSERRVLDVRCDALLVDLRAAASRHPGLVDRARYTFCQQVGAYLHAQGQNGLLTRSARSDGVNAALLVAERLSDPRDKVYLTYRCNPVQDECVVEREPGRVWLRVRPSTLA